MNAILVAYVVMVALHNVDGEEMLLNIDHIIMLQHTKEAEGRGPNQLVGTGNKCVIVMINGKVGVVEPCGMVRQAIREAR